jgi:AraC-like DNA-binding protein
MLRRAGIGVKEIHLHKLPELQNILNVSKIRVMELYALSEFQSLPSIGIRFAYDLISMGYYSLKQLKGKDGAKLIDQFELQAGVWIDPCVEDQFRLVVHHAKHPESQKNWWDFTAERKVFRAKNGYPATRPNQPWFDLPQYQVHNQLLAKKQETKKDLHSRLKSSLRFMTKNLSQAITLRQLADASSLSSFHFLRNFKSAYSKTPFQYLTEMRLKHACKLLRDTGLSITEVMSACGLENLSSFVRLFKRRFGKTPGGYRKEVLDQRPQNSL